MLHLTKVAVGCSEPDQLAARLDARATAGETWIETRYRPTRHTELIGGSLYWIIKHQLIGRHEIAGFEEVDGRCRIRLVPGLIPVRPRPKRAHQGWRYLTAIDAPADYAGGGEELATMPAPMVRELAALYLI